MFFGVVAAVILLGGCDTIGIGTRVTDLGDGRYRIVTSQADDVATANTAAARDRCPGGYAVLQKGSRAESLYGSVIKGSDLATFWIIRCASGK
ncbi:MAG: hypothetical protein JWM91_5168 [Rhodospirillales bacterium]|nr:hypothetical protein [Rhodospirillales bacterium]